jgi:pilus assembly protein CpaB
MNRRIIAVLVAAVLALGGGALVIAYAKSADARAIASAQPTSVWVAKKLVPAGTTLKDAQRSELIVQTQVAASAVPTGALQDVNADNNALLALSDVQPGEYLLSARFGTTPVGTKAIEVPAGMLAVSVELKDPARVGKFVTPGSHIAIYSSYQIKALGDDPRSKVINENDVKGTSVLLDDVQVIGMGDSPLAAPATPTTDDKTAQAKDESQAPSFLVTVAVTPEQATRLVHGINEYELYAALRGSDVKINPNAQTNDTNIFGTVLP